MVRPLRGGGTTKEKELFSRFVAIFGKTNMALLVPKFWCDIFFGQNSFSATLSSDDHYYSKGGDKALVMRPLVEKLFLQLPLAF